MTKQAKLLWWTLLLLGVFGAWWMARGAIGPLPQMLLPPKVFKSAAGIGQGAGAAALVKSIKRPAVRTKAMPGGYLLLWDWTGDAYNPSSNVVFNVCSIRDPMPLSTPRANWPVRATVSTNGCPFTVDKTILYEFWIVRASNTVTHSESL